MDLAETNHMTFSVIEVASSMGWESRVVRSELMALQFSDQGTCPTPNGIRSTVVVDIEGLAFHLLSPGDLSAEERDTLIQMLNSKVSEQQKREVERLHLLHTVLRAVATEMHDAGVNIEAREQGAEVKGVGGTQSLKDIIQQYFSPEGVSVEDLAKEGILVAPTLSPQLSHEEEELIGHDVVTMVTRFSDQTFTGRAVARIFHGIPSPRFPALVWGAQRGFWRRWLQVDFTKLCQLAKTKLVQFR